MEYIIAGIGAFVAFIAANQWIIPLINDLIDKFKNRKKNKSNDLLDVENELVELEKNNNNKYENQIVFFVSQIDILQKQLQRKTDELVELNNSLDDLREQLLTIKEQLHEQKRINLELINNQCFNCECQFRIKNKIK